MNGNIFSERSLASLNDSICSEIERKAKNLAPSDNRAKLSFQFWIVEVYKSHISVIYSTRDANYAGDHSRVNNNARLTGMQIFIVYARIHDLIASVRIIVRFYTSSARGRLTCVSRNSLGSMRIYKARSRRAE